LQIAPKATNRYDPPDGSRGMRADERQEGCRMKAKVLMVAACLVVMGCGGGGDGGEPVRDTGILATNVHDTAILEIDDGVQSSPTFIPSGGQIFIDMEPGVAYTFQALFDDDVIDYWVSFGPYMVEEGEVIYDDW